MLESTLYIFSYLLIKGYKFISNASYNENICHGRNHNVVLTTAMTHLYISHNPCIPSGIASNG